MAPEKLRRSRSTIDTTYTLRRLFKKDSFRFGQEEIINASLNNEDILVIFPVGHGKSLTYQLPAVAVDHGCTIVISPLLALMANQVDGLRKRGINAVTLNGTVDIEQRRLILNDLACGHPRIRLIYVSPELCAFDSFRKVIDTLYRQGELNRIVIDEAHCCVEWGHSFRHNYAKLGYFKQKYPQIPISALTATAPTDLRKEIVKILRLPSEPELKVFMSSSNRPNIHYEVRFMSGAATRNDILSFLLRYSEDVSTSPSRKEGSTIPKRRLHGPGIIYCRQRSTTEFLAVKLREAGYGAQAFHARLKNQEKATVMDKWVESDPNYQVIVATVAFGMGVEKPDVRFVIHYDLPNNIESYYQGSGRAGRDNKTARCILYYSNDDAMMLSTLQSTSKLSQAMRKKRKDKNLLDDKGFLYLMEYCQSYDRCRHLMLSNYFDKEGVPSAPDSSWCNYACDYCKDKEELKKRRLNAISEEFKDMSDLYRMDDPFEHLC